MDGDHALGRGPARVTGITNLEFFLRTGDRKLDLKVDGDDF